MRRAVLVVIVYAPLLVLAALIGGWVALILCSMFGALVGGVWLDERR